MSASHKVIRVGIVGCGEVAQVRRPPPSPPRTVDSKLEARGSSRSAGRVAQSTWTRRESRTERADPIDLQTTHLPTLALLNHLYTVTALCDVWPGLLDHCAAKFGISRTYSD